LRGPDSLPGARDFQGVRGGARRVVALEWRGTFGCGRAFRTRGKVSVHLGRATAILQGQRGARPSLQGRDSRADALRANLSHYDQLGATPGMPSLPEVAMARRGRPTRCGPEGSRRRC
jgi:hypothetical protein